jgi:hypothetical protein
MTSLPTALLAVSRNRTLEVRLDTCAQFSIAGDALRQYGRCLTRSAPVDIVEGFGGGQARVLGVWQFVGTNVRSGRFKLPKSGLEAASRAEAGMCTLRHQSIRCVGSCLRW